jgi:hypothetical protein
LETTLTPLISKVSLKCLNGEKDINSIVPNPKSIPYILKDDIINFYITFSVINSKKKQFCFEYEDSMNNFMYKSEIELPPITVKTNTPFVDKMSHFKVLRSLEASANEHISI